MSVLKNLNLHSKLLVIVGWAAASMVMLPALGWSSLHDQTHTVLVTAVTAGTCLNIYSRSINKHDILLYLQ